MQEKFWFSKSKIEDKMFMPMAYLPVLFHHPRNTWLHIPVHHKKKVSATLSNLNLSQSNSTFEIFKGLVLGASISPTVLDCCRCCLSKYSGFTWMLRVKPSSFSIIRRVWGGKTSFQVLKRRLILDWTEGSTCLYALQNTYNVNEQLAST